MIRGLLDSSNQELSWHFFASSNCVLVSNLLVSLFSAVNVVLLIKFFSFFKIFEFIFFCSKISFDREAYML